MQVPLTDEYAKLDGNNVIFIKGNPTLSEVKVMMLGVWNPSGENPSFPHVQMMTDSQSVQKYGSTNSGCLTSTTKEDVAYSRSGADKTCRSG